MDNSQFICFCRKMFSDQTAFKDHLPCVDFVSAVNKKAKLDVVPPKAVNEARVSPRRSSRRKKSKPVCKVIKLTEVASEREKGKVKLIPTDSTNIGKRLPSRTKVPFLSRAISLSADHSFERCTCGAVFVTRVGKRQHQARFCKLAKNNKSEKTIANDSEKFISSIQNVSDSEFEIEYVEDGDSVINEIYHEQPIMQYEVQENCMV